MNPADPAFPGANSEALTVTPGMDLRTYMATAFLASFAVAIRHDITDENMRIDVNNAVTYADALIARLNAK